MATAVAVDLAAQWYDLLRRRRTLVRLSAPALSVLRRIPLEAVQAGAPPGEALSWSRCLAGAAVFPWGAVTTAVEAGSVATGVRAVCVYPVEDHPLGFGTYEPLGDYPHLSPDGGVPSPRPAEPTDEANVEEVGSEELDRHPLDDVPAPSPPMSPGGPGNA